MSLMSVSGLPEPSHSRCWHPYFPCGYKKASSQNNQTGNFLHIPSPDTGPGYIIRIRTHPFHIHARGNIVSGIRSEISAFQLQPIIACKQAVQLNTCANLTGNVIFWFQIKVRYPVIGFTLAVKCTSSLYISAIVGHGMQRIWSRTSSASLSVRLKSPPLGTGVRLSVLRHGD